jgi:hypothetical protein
LDLVFGLKGESGLELGEAGGKEVILAKDEVKGGTKLVRVMGDLGAVVLELE